MSQRFRYFTLLDRKFKVNSKLAPRQSVKSGHKLAAVFPTNESIGRNRVEERLNLH